MTNRTRGNALILVLVALAVLSLLAVAAIRFTGTSRDAAIAKNRGDQVQSCVEVARRFLLSQLPTQPLSPNPGAGDINPADSTVTFERVLPDDPTDAGRSIVATAHFNDPVKKPTIVGISALSIGSSKRQIRDVANNLGPATLGGQNYRVVVRCIEPGTTRASELEFAFRYGI